MKKGIKKAAAGIIAISTVCALCGCNDNGYIMTVEGMDIRNGIYISFVQSALGDAEEKLSEIQNEESSEESSENTEQSESKENTESTGSTESSEDVFSKEVEGKSYSDWVKDDALRAAKRFVVIFKTCEENGIELGDDEIQGINDEVNNEWDASNDYARYIYGVNTLGEFYEAQGIGKDSMKEISKANLLNNKLFDYYYGLGGEKEVPDEEFDAYVEENYSACRIINLPFTDYKGETLESDADKDAIRAKAKEYADRVNNGEQMIDIKYDVDLENAQNSAHAKAEEDYDEENSEGLSKEDYINKAVEEATAVKSESDDTLDEVVSNSSTRYSADMIDLILNAESSNKAFVFDGDSGCYIIVKHSILTLENWEESNYDSVIHEMKNDEFNEMMEEKYVDFTVNSNDYLVNNKYSPEKIRDKQMELINNAQNNQ